MDQVMLGNTGLMVSRVGFCGIPIQRLSEDEAVAVVRGCLDLGITFIDTAHGYTTSEERIGKAIRGRREGLVLASKTPGRDRATARQHIELSLKRLGVDHIEVYQLHGISTPENFEKVLAPDGALRALIQAKEEGLIGHIGVSSHSLSIAKRLVASGHFETMQFPFNFIADEGERDLLPLAREHGVALIAMKPLGGGLIPNARLAMRYIAQFPDVVPDPGIQDVAEMIELISALEGFDGLTEADHAEMAAAKRELGTRFCHRCDYCQPCPQGINISMVLSVGSNLRRFPLERAFGDFAGLVAKARTCVQCGDCEGRCPYELPIRDMLVERATFYDAERARYRADPSGYRIGRPVV